MSTSSSLDPNQREAQCVGEATDLVSFLQHVDDWLASVPVMSIDFPLFRGQEDESWQLVPAIGRKPHQLRLRPNSEQRMLDEFKQRALPHVESTVELTNADWLAIAQHHAMPTRLLDWSGSALAALWFAVKRPAVKKPCENRSCEKPDGRGVLPGAVWMLPGMHADLISPAESNNPLGVGQTRLLKPRHVSRRIAAQDGWFTVHRGKQSGLDTTYFALDANPEFRGRLRYIRIPGDAFGTIRGQLQRAGINRGVLFPDLDGVAGRITDAILYPDDQEPPGAGNLGEA
ncbi:FRG domain-containing protein [Burkholderia anthina]|uniref:FRG domain-containing protein n=1 Tax=Burkholderia anthina TaxID=179879 RepID=UPI0015885818|nr:FRG domain-containing protein [Burkholderia anthina]